MADVGQGEIGDPMELEGILAPPKEDDYFEVPLVGVGPQ